MDPKKELERIDLNNQVDFMPANPWEFDVDLGTNSGDSMRKILTIASAVAKRSAENWPSDDDWRSIFPDWLKHAIPELSKEQADKLLADTPREQWDSLPWDFLSWLDALRERGWRWWSYKIGGSTVTIVLHIAMFPERIDAFRELLRAAGARIVEERYAAL